MSTDIGLRSNLDSALNEKLPSPNFSRQRVRLSFSNLLDFFGKLEYYLRLGLMTEAEANYFSYYIEKCANNTAIKTFAEKYNFDLFLSMAETRKFFLRET